MAKLEGEKVGFLFGEKKRCKRLASGNALSLYEPPSRNGSY
ncbi:MAG: hypothetical protein P1U86_14340 [Verrucomicrobiales bacterium]|nr:hypothetical protein [Verrucomicrobiales bacterium]